MLQAIKACVGRYEASTISLYSVTLWDALKFEILNVEEEDLAEESLAILGLIASQLSLASEGALNAYLKPVIKECNEHLEDAPTKQSQASGRILNIIGRSSPVLADTLTKAVLPHLFQLFQSSESISKRRGLIEVLNLIVKATIDASASWRTTDENGVIVKDHADSNTLKDFSTEASEALLRVVINAPKSEVSFRLYAIEGLVGLVKVRKLLEDAEVARIIEACTDIIVQEKTSANQEIEAAAIKGLTEIAHYNPTITSERALPTFLAELPDSPALGSGYEQVLEAFTKLSTETQIFDTVVLRLKNKLNAAVHQKAHISYIHALLMAILFAFSNGSPGTEDGIIKSTYFSDIVKPFLDQALGRADVDGSLLYDETSIDIIGRISNIILKSQGMHVQNQVLAEYEPSFQSFGEGTHKPRSSAAVIASLHLNAAFQRDSVTPDAAAQLLGVLGGVAQDHNVSAVVKLAALRHVSLVVNKLIPPASLEQSLATTALDVTSLVGPARSAESIMLAFSTLR